MDIDGLGEKQVAPLQDDGPRARRAADFYRLTAEQLMELEGYGEISARPAASRRSRRSKERPFGRVLFAHRHRGASASSPARNLAQQLPLDRRAAGGDARADRARRRASARSWPALIHEQLADDADARR